MRLLSSRRAHPGVVVYDPLYGERTLSRETFRTAWALMRNVAVLVAK